MTTLEQPYLDLLQNILDNGDIRPDRTGTGTRSIFGAQMRFNLRDGFPLITTKRTWWKGIVHELLWFLKGSTNIKYLTDNKVNIWNEWADENGELGPVYGAQWTKLKDSEGNEINQIENLVKGLKENPYGRRHIVSAWNVGEIPKMKLPPCHMLAQWYVSSKNELSCQLLQRSVDTILGFPYNIASYSLLTHMLAQVCGLEVGEFIHVSGDAHLYENHIEQAKEQLTRTPLPPPTIKLNPEVKSIFDFKYEDIELIGYNHCGRIDAPIAV